MGNKYQFLSVLCLCAVLTLQIMAQEQTITMTTSKAVGEQVTLKVNHTFDGVTVDWGGGTTTTYNTGDEKLRTVTGTLQGQTIKLTGSKYITTLICSGQQITSLDVSNATYLQSIYAQNNELTAIDVKGLTKLKDLNVSGNKLSGRIDLRNTTVPALETLDISDNELTNIANSTVLNLTGSHANLQYLRAARNKFSRAYLNAFSKLDYADVSGIGLTNVSVKTSSYAADALTVLNAADNNLTTVDVSNCTLMSDLFLNNNSINELDVTALTKLKNVSVAGNEMTSMLQNSTNLMFYDISGNRLYFRALPKTTARPKYMVVGPQLPFIIVDENGNRITSVQVCPNYDERSNTDYIMNLANYRYDGNGRAQSTLTILDISENEEGAPLVAYNTSTGEGDYVLTTGKYVFFTNHERCILRLTHSLGYFADYIFVSAPFAIGSELTGISQATADVEKSERILVEPSAGSVVITSLTGTQPVNIFDAGGRKVWGGTVEKSITVKLPNGIYVVNGKKVLL